MPVVMLALLALGLTVLGVYGVIAYQSAQRAREIALRIAVAHDQNRHSADVPQAEYTDCGDGRCRRRLHGDGCKSSGKSMMLVSGTIGVGSVALTATLVFAMVLGASFLPAARASWRDPAGVLKDV